MKRLQGFARAFEAVLNEGDICAQIQRADHDACANDPVPIQTHQDGESFVTCGDCLHRFSP